MTTAATPKAGLEDTVATSSAICYLDGDRGVLAYCGFDIHDLAQHATFEEVCYLLWHRRLPTRARARRPAVAARRRPRAARGCLRLMRSLPPRRRHGPAADADVGARATTIPTRPTIRRPANYRKAVRLTAQIGSLVATMGRMAKGGGADRSGSGARPRGQLPLHADGRSGPAASRRARSTSRWCCTPITS